MSETTKIFRKGDVVSLTGVVAYDHQQTDGTVTVEVNGTNVYLKQDTLTLHMPKFHPGEEVDFDGVDGKVLATAGDEVWLKISDGTTVIVYATGLKLKPAAPKGE